MAAAGLSPPHVNGRTEQDYARWGDLIAERPEIEILAFEFATGAGVANGSTGTSPSSAPSPIGSVVRSRSSSRRRSKARCELRATSRMPR